MKVSLIAAVSDNGVIGTGEGGIPWELPRDARHFREYTAGKWMLLGRKTYEEMEGWFRDQTPLVMTRQSDYSLPQGYAVSSVEEAIAEAEKHGAEELVVSGGAEIYRAALPFVTRMIITRIHNTLKGTKTFPEEDWERWTLVKDEEWPADEDNIYNMTLQIYVSERNPKR
ncbi:MAG: dihydrofolate reductase [Verrucomicrobiales bacterium]|nr:dihydrofolate reductase [Verrucomicrobiales bacterium]